VRRLDLTTLNPGTQFTISSPLFGPYVASDLAVMPGNPNVLATVGYSDGIQVWDVTNSGATARTLTNAIVNNVYRLSLNPSIEPIHHFPLRRERKLMGAVENQRVEPLRLADGLI
jgi:hypothetical protein